MTRGLNLKLPVLIRQLLLSWLLAVTIEYILLPAELRPLSALEGLAQMSLWRILAITGIGAVVLQGVSRFVNTQGFERWGIVSVFAILAVISLCSSFTLAFLGACILVLLVLIVYSVRGWNRDTVSIAIPKRESKAYAWITVMLSILFFLFVSAWTVGRVYNFSAPTYDFGIFSQMFYNMKRSGSPMTTLERDGLLSHFHVHVSPIYYLLLPFYFLVPIPATLQVLQAAVMTSSVIPLWKIGKLHGLSESQRMFFCALLLLYPAFSGGASYDIHENCFLTPLLLWLLYGIDKRQTGIIAAAALLTCMVKEDAAVYVAVISLWMILKSVLHHRKGSLKDLLTGLGMLAGSLTWFLLVTHFLAETGDGVMTYRYDNFIYDESSSLLTVVKSVILNPMKAVYECVDPEKLAYIALTLLPLFGLPLLTRRFERYILLIPYILVNLMSDYAYQHNIFFQYNFGTTALLLYLVSANLSDLKIYWMRALTLATAVLISAVCFGILAVPKGIYYPVQSVRYHTCYQQIRDTLSQIPEDASVTATTFYTTTLSQREVLYDVGYASKAHMLSTEYIVLDTSSESAYKKYASDGINGLQNLLDLLDKNGYAVFAEIPDVLVIYHRS